MATHSNVVAWRIPGTRDPGGPPSMGLQSRTRLKRLSSSSSSLDQFKKSIGFCGHNIIDYILKLKSLAVKIINVTSDRVEGGHISERIALEVKDMDGKLQHVCMNRESLLQGHERKTGD